jgi:hypothetical protein
LLIDRLVVRDVLSALSPPTLEAALAAIEEARGEQASVERTYARQLEQIEHEVEATRRRYLLVDPQHSMVKVDLEQKLEEALHRRDSLRQQHAGRQTLEVSLSEQDAQEVVTLSKDVTRLWNAPTTTAEDRKLLLRTVIKKIYVHDPTEDMLKLELVWVGGFRELKHIPLSEAVYRTIKDLHDGGCSPREITERLMRLGMTTKSGKPFKNNTVRMRLYALGVSLARPRAAARLQALQRVRQLVVVERRPPREALRILRGESHPFGGAWNRSRLWRSLRSLEQVPGIVAALRETYRLPIAMEASEIIRRGRQAGESWGDLAERLNAGGFRPPKAARFSAVQLRILYRHLSRRGLVEPVEGRRPMGSTRQPGSLPPPVHIARSREA